VKKSRWHCIGHILRMEIFAKPGGHGAMHWIPTVKRARQES